MVKIRVKPSNTEITVSKGLLCAESPVFRSRLNLNDGNFKDSQNQVLDQEETDFEDLQEQVLDLEEMDDVVSVRALQALFQWLYQGIIKFDIENPEEHISAAMELVRFADIYGIDRLETKMAEYIKTLLCSDTPGRHHTRDSYYDFDRNNTFVKRDHIISALNLPYGHAVRRLLAAASVEGYLGKDKYKFVEMTREYPLFAADLLQEVQLALLGMEGTAPHVEDPIRE